jgi:hypothetical protein
MEQRILRTYRQSINYDVNTLQNAFDDWGDSDSSITNSEEESLDSHPPTTKPAPVIQLRTAPSGISKGA